MIARAPHAGGFKPESTLYRSQQHPSAAALGRFATGVAIVTFDGVQRSSRHHRELLHLRLDGSAAGAGQHRPHHQAHDELEGRPFTVNVLGAEQQALALHFAGQPGREPLWVEGETAPRLSGCSPTSSARPGPPTTAATTPSTWARCMDFNYRSGRRPRLRQQAFTTIPESLLGIEALL